MSHEAKATHRRILHQLAALWVKGMTGAVGQALILNLNDCDTLGEMTFTDFERV